MFKSLSTSLIARGILAVIIGIVALAWPGVTVLALVIMFAVYAFTAAGLQAARAFSSRTAGPVARAPAARAGRPGRRGHRAGLARAHRAGPGADRGRLGDHRRPGRDRRRLRSGEPAGTRAMLILGGLATIAFGVVLCARPGIGAVTLAAAVRPVQPHRRELGAGAGHRTAPHRQDPALHPQDQDHPCGLSQASPHGPRRIPALRAAGRCSSPRCSCCSSPDAQAWAAGAGPTAGRPAPLPRSLAAMKGSRRSGTCG